MEDAIHPDVGIIQGNIHNFKNALALQLLVQVFEIQSMWGRERLIFQMDAWEPFLWRRGGIVGHCFYSITTDFSLLVHITYAALYLFLSLLLDPVLQLISSCSKKQQQLELWIMFLENAFLPSLGEHEFEEWKANSFFLAWSLQSLSAEFLLLIYMKRRYFQMSYGKRSMSLKKERVVQLLFTCSLVVMYKKAFCILTF